MCAFAQVVYFISYAEVTSSSSAPALIKQIAKKESEYNPQYKALYYSLDSKMLEIKTKSNYINK